jgi:hypothetical protein
MAQAASDPFAQFDTPAPVAASAPTNDNTTPAPGFTSVIDVGPLTAPGTTYDPNAPQGTPGSQTAPSLVGAPTSTGQQVAPITERQEFGEAMKNLAGEPLPPVKMAPEKSPPPSPAPRAAQTQATPSAAGDPFAAFDQPAAATSAATPAATLGQPPAAQTASPGTTKTAAEQPPAPAQQELRQQPWYQPLWNAAQTVDSTLKGAQDVAAHSATFGLDEIVAPLPAAVARSLSTGEPFSTAYDNVVQEQRAQRGAFESQHPVASALIGLTAGVGAPVAATAPLFAGAPAASIVGRGINAARNIAAGAGVGAISGAGETDGDIQARLAGARQGAEFGGILSTAAPIAGAVANRLGTALRPNAAVDPMAGTILRESAQLGPGAPVPPPEPSALPGMPIGSGAAFNNPGIAARERNINATDDAGRQAQILAQNQAIRNAAAPAAPAGVHLARDVTTPEASASVVKALQDAHGILKDEEDRLWNTPAMLANTPDKTHVQTVVAQAIAALPQRFQQAWQRSPDLKAAMEELRDLRPGATLADFNDVRSGILDAVRSLPYSERFAKRVGNDAASAVLKGIESNPSLRTNPTALADYQKARAFTNSMRTALETPQFQRMLQATAGNRKGIDPGTVAASMYNFGTGTEKSPGAVTRITDMLNDVRRTWSGLQGGNTGAPISGLSPASAAAARDELAQANRDLIVHSMLDSAASNVRDQAGNQRLLMNKLSDWIDTNSGWLKRSGAMNQPQLDLLDRIKKASIQAASAENLRGGTNSATFERLKGDRYVDAFIGPFLGRVLPASAGLAAGSVATHLFGEAGIGGMIGMELAGGVGGHMLGRPMLERLYAAPRARLMERLTEAIRDPQIAEDLMKKAGEKVNPKTRQWVRSFFALAPSSAMAPQEQPQ